MTVIAQDDHLTAGAWACGRPNKWELKNSQSIQFDTYVLNPQGQKKNFFRLEFERTAISQDVFEQLSWSYRRQLLETSTNARKPIQTVSNLKL